MLGSDQGRPQLRFPAAGRPLAPDEEWCEVVVAGERQRVRFHDYHDIYRIPGLYEYLFHERLGCSSPAVVCALLGQVLDQRGLRPDELRVLEVGAGNGVVGEELARLGVADLVAVDVLPEAAEAARRDRPSIYREYYVADLGQLTGGLRQRLELARFNCLVAVSALGFGDIPTAAILNALSLLTAPGLIAFNVHEQLLGSGALDSFLGSGRPDAGPPEGYWLVPLVRQRYQHRLTTAGLPVHYVAWVAERGGPAT